MLTRLPLGPKMEYDAIPDKKLADTGGDNRFTLSHEATQLQTDHCRVIITAEFGTDILSLVRCDVALGEHRRCGAKTTWLT